MKQFKIDISFILITICILLSPFQKEYFKLVLVLVIHEFGHLFFIFLFRIQIHSLKLYALGFLMDIETKNLSCIKDIFIYSGGILFNLISLFILPETMKPFVWFLIFINILPIYPLDGFMILKTIISYICPYRFSLWMSHIIGIVSLGFVTFFLISKMDYLLLINLISLFYISFVEIKKIKYSYSSFMLKRYLEPTDYAYRKIRFRHNSEAYLYRYHKIYMKVGMKRIEEEDILKLKYH